MSKMLTARESSQIDFATKKHGHGHSRKSLVGSRSSACRHRPSFATSEPGTLEPLPSSDRPSATGFYVALRGRRGKTLYSWAMVSGPGTWKATPPPKPFGTESQADAIAHQFCGYVIAL